MVANPALGVRSNRLCAMDDFLKPYLERLKTESSKRSSEIAASKCTSFEDYKAKCAYVQGLQDAIKWLGEAHAKALRPEDEMRLTERRSRARSTLYD